MGIALLVGVVALVPLLGGDPPPEEAKRKLSAAGWRMVDARSLGARLRVPPRWTVSRRGGGLQLRSPDRAVALAIAAPTGRGHVDEVLGDAIAVIGRNHRQVRVSGQTDKRLAGRSARSVVVEAINARGAQVRLLVSAAAGRRRTYLVEVAGTPGSPRLLEAQLVLNSLRLRG